MDKPGSPGGAGTGVGGSPMDAIKAGLAAGKVQEDFLQEITRDFARLQRQKTRKTGGVEVRMLTSRAFRWGEQFVSQDALGLVVEPREANKLRLSFNLLEGACARLSGRITSLGGQFYSRPDKKGAQARSDSEIVDKLLNALDEKLDQPARTWELVDTLLTDGVAFEYVPWIPNSTITPTPQFDLSGQELMFTFSAPGTPPGTSPEVIPQSVRDQMIAQGIPQEAFEIQEELEVSGDVGSEILSGLSVFVDQSVRSIEDLAPDQAVYLAKIRTKGWIEDNYGPQDEEAYGGELKIVTTNFIQHGEASASLFLKDLIPMFQGENGADDPDMALVVERYQPSSKANPRGRFTCFIPSKSILFDGPNPYEEIPLVDFHFRPVTSTFWTKDFITDLIVPQKFLNKRLSQIGEQANASIYDKILAGGQISSKDIAPDAPQVIEKAYSDNGQPLVSRLAGPSLPQWFLESIDLNVKLFQQIAGGSDLFQEHQFPGQLRGPMAVPMLQELLDSQWGPLYQHIGQRMARVKQMRLNRVKQFYPPVRTMHYTDVTQRDEVLDFHSEKILRAGTNYSITVERGSLIPEFRALREARVRERLQSPLGILYTDPRTGGLDKSKIADDLQFGDDGRESRESNSRKFAVQLIDKLWKGQPIPPVLQFWDHEPMLDELEASMMTTEWLSASPQVQQLFIDRWNQHSGFLAQRAQMQAQSMMNQGIQNAVAQATQQAAAMAASQTVHSTQMQIGAQEQAQGGPPPLTQLISSQGGGLAPGSAPQGGQNGQSQNQAGGAIQQVSQLHSNQPSPQGGTPPGPGGARRRPNPRG